MCATVFASFADTASAHFLLDVNIRVFHVVHEQDRIRLLVRLPMSYLVADKLGPETAGGTRAPAHYTTNRIEDGKVVHYLDAEALSIVYAATVVLTAVGHRMTTLVTALLGALHGLGFSIVLKEILKLDAPNLLQSVLAFNVGIEIGQLLIVVALWPILVFIARRSPKWIIPVRWAVVLPCVLVATIWTGERGSQFFSSL